MEAPLCGVQKTAFLGDRYEIPEMTKFHFSALHLCFTSIVQAIKVFVQAPDAEEAISQRMALVLSEIQITGVSTCHHNTNQPSYSATAFGPMAHASARSSPHCRRTATRSLRFNTAWSRSKRTWLW